MKVNPAILAIVIGVLISLAFAGGFALSDWRINPETLARYEKSTSWECVTHLRYKLEDK